MHGRFREKGFYLVNWKISLEFQLYKKKESLFYSLTTLSADDGTLSRFYKTFSDKARRS